MSIAIKPGGSLPGEHFKKKASGGFTLLELLVVVVIIGVLASFAIPAYYSYIDKARMTVAYSTLDTMRKTLELFHINNQRYPQNLDFSTGEENPAAPDTTTTVFSSTLLEQINNDIIVTNADYIYNTATFSYTLTAKARDSDQTIMILTPNVITKAP